MKYCEVIQQQKMQELRLKTIAEFQSTGYASGNIKQQDFMKFLDSLKIEKEKKKVDINKTMASLKSFNINVEEK